jgi:thiamine-phosphate pyrophosphorylase
MVSVDETSTREHTSAYEDEQGEPSDHEPALLPSSLFVITDRHRASRPLTSVLQDAVYGGARWLRVREPDLGLFEYIALCHALIESVRNARVVWSVRPAAYAMMRSAYPELRLAVHLTGRDAEWAGPDPSLLIGRSVHGVVPSGEVMSPQAAYLLLAPVFNTDCKPDVPPLGVTAISARARQASQAIVALGGVTVNRVAACRAAGASAVAVCGGIMESADPAERVRAYLDTWASFMAP